MSRYHPLVIFSYFISVIVITMLTMNPFILVISLLASILLAYIYEKKKILMSLIFYFLIFILIVIINPFFSQYGDNILFTIRGFKITQESVFYGMGIALMLVSVMIWFRSYNIIMSTDKVLYLFQKVAPNLALITSMGIKMIPTFKRQIHRISDAQKGLGLYANTSTINKLKTGQRSMSILITWSLENAIDTADSMKARGYGLKGKASFSIFKFRLSDGIMLLSIISIIAVFTIAKILKVLDFEYYPIISEISLSYQSLISYTFISLLMFLPFILEVKEKIKWQYLRSKI